MATQKVTAAVRNNLKLVVPQDAEFLGEKLDQVLRARNLDEVIARTRRSNPYFYLTLLTVLGVLVGGGGTAAFLANRPPVVDLNSASERLANRAIAASTSDPQTAALQAIAAYTVAQTPRSREAMLKVSIDNSLVGRRFPAHRGRITAMAADTDGRRLFTAGDDRTIRVWDPASATQITSTKATNIQALARQPGGPLLAGVDAVGTVYQWRFDESSGTMTPPDQVGQGDGQQGLEIAGLGYANSGRLLYEVTSLGQVRAWDVTGANPTGLREQSLTEMLPAAARRAGNVRVRAASAVSGAERDVVVATDTGEIYTVDLLSWTARLMFTSAVRVTAVATRTLRGPRPLRSAPSPACSYSVWTPPATSAAASLSACRTRLLVSRSTRPATHWWSPPSAEWHSQR